jgi:hypothetical protein
MIKRNTLNAAYEFNVNGKPKMMEFEVRQFITAGGIMVIAQNTPATRYGADGL